MIHVVVGIILNATGHILIAQRPSHKPEPGLWEFPGGNVEVNEASFPTLPSYVAFVQRINRVCDIFVPLVFYSPVTVPISP